MLWKLLLVALLAAGVNGRTVVNESPSYDPSYPYNLYDAYSTKFIAEYCNSNITSEKAFEIRSSVNTFLQCLSNLVDRDAVTREFSEAVDKYDYTEVFKKYCAKTPELKTCLKPFYAALAVCQSADELRMEEEASNNVLEFACDNDGAKLALFFNEGGVQCIEEKGSIMSSCIQSTDIYTKSKNMSSRKMDCKDREQVLTCVVQGLKGCQNPVPGTFAEELRELVLKSYHCPKIGEIRTSTEGASKIKQSELPQNSEFSQQLELLKKRKLELEVRNAEIETWNRENELSIQHTILTSDINIKSIQPVTPENNQLG